MRRFEQALKLENVRYDIRGRISEEAERLSDAGIDILKLNTGNPAPFGLTAPEELTPRADRKHHPRAGLFGIPGALFRP